MAQVAREAVLLPSAAPRGTPADVKLRSLPAVAGPSHSHLQSTARTLDSLATTGYQASHFSQAVAVCQGMLAPQPPSVSGAEEKERTCLVQPTIFLGATANLFGTGCREAIRFLCAESLPLPEGVEPGVLPDDIITPCKDDDNNIPNSSFFSKALIHALVVSGGAMEHDIRRACQSYQIITEEENEEKVSNIHQKQEKYIKTQETWIKFGNLAYKNDESSVSLFKTVMRRLISRVQVINDKRKSICASKPIPPVYNDICSWAISPSSFWYMAGVWLPELLAESLVELGLGKEDMIYEEAQRRAESTVIYWAAKNDVPIFSPSFVDGDIMEFILQNEEFSLSLIKLDLVSDIHRINRLAMRSRRTGMIILGGGVVKHHVCNANLMRNGADSTVIINNGQEFDGSDAGARPDEAISWGKIRLDAEYVKVYAEVSLVFPMLVAQTFLPWVREARSNSHLKKKKVVDNGNQL